MRRRNPGQSESPPPTRGPDSTVLAALLRARRFRLGAGTSRVQANLTAHGGEIASDAAPWIGQARPPADAPTVSLGEHAGTLGPRSFGFLNNVGGVAALDAPVPAMPRKGGLALVVPRRDALPDVVPLAIARGLGVSWIVSVGDGDPAEALAFAGADAATHGIALVLGDGADGATLRSVLGLKPTVVWGGDAICRAVARRAGARVVDGVDEWLARAALLDANIEPGARVSVVVIGGGAGFVAAEVAAAGLDATVKAVDDREPAELRDAVAAAVADGRPLVLVAGGPPEAPERPPVEPLQLLSADLRHPEHLRALLRALAAAAPIDAPAAEPKKARVDAALVARVRAEIDNELNDHDAKRLLKAYGARVTRQAPTNTPTGAANVAKVIGLPVLLVAGEDVRVAETLPDVRRLTTLMLQAMAEQPDVLPSVIVRERFPDVPRMRATVVVEKGLGLTMRVGATCALLPLTRNDAAALAAATPARRSADQKSVAELLGHISACAEEEKALLDVEIYVGAEPCVVEAVGQIRK